MDFRDHLFTLNEAEKDDEPSSYNPIALAGRAVGTVRRWFDKGHSKGYGGTRNRLKHGYSANEASDCEQSSIALGVGLGKAYDTGNRLYNININQYHDSDASFVGDGEDPETSRVNIPAILAARMAGGSPDPKTISNGINKRASSGAFKLKPLRDDFGQNG